MRSDQAANIEEREERYVQEDRLGCAELELANLHIIQALIDHVDDIVPLFDSYRQFYGQSRDMEGARQFLAERLNRKESVIYLALEDEKAVGFVQLYPSFSSESMKPLWILNDLFVATQARGRGVGKALLVKSREFAKVTGAKGLVLQTGINNSAAQGLYESLGWKRDELFYSYYLNL